MCVCTWGCLDDAPGSLSVMERDTWYTWRLVLVGDDGGRAAALLPVDILPGDLGGAGGL